SPNRLRRRFTQTQILDLSGFHQIAHCPDGIFDWYVGIDSMLIVEIDAIDAQTLERSVTGRAHVFRSTVDRSYRRIGRVAYDGKLCSYDHIIAMVSKCFAHQFFICERAVRIGGIKEIDSQLE